MREILFRAKRKDNGAWETGSLVFERMGTSEERVYIADKMTAYHTPVFPETVGEFTGLTDKHGVKIFEGDVIECGYVLGIVTYQIGTERNDYTAVFVVSWIFADYLRQELGFWATQRDITVIGNIYDNPELLGGDSDD